MSTTMDQIGSHLEFLGYEIVKGENGAMRAIHKSRFNIIIREFGFGIIFSTFLGVNSQGKSNRGNLLERVNAFNMLASVSHCYVDKDYDLVFETCIPNTYEKLSFGTFIETFNNDFRVAANNNDVQLIAYLN